MTSFFLIPGALQSLMLISQKIYLMILKWQDANDYVNVSLNDMTIIKSVIRGNYGVVHNLHRPIFQILYVILNKAVTQKWKDLNN